jgi:hypothetical protein
MSRSRDKARAELAAYLAGTQYDITPTAPTLEQREIKANKEVTLLSMLDKRFKRVGTADNGMSTYHVRGDVNHRMIDDLHAEFGTCARCKQPRIGECVEIISGLTSNRIRVHLACVEDGDDLA